MSIIEAITKFFQTQGFMPHGMCLLWRPAILWTIVTGNAVIAFSYFMIPIALIYLVLKRRDMGFKWIFVLFGAFILACGCSHVMGIVTLWYPAYGLEALILAFTGMVSLLTAILLWPLLPVLFKIPSPWLLEKLNNDLKNKNDELAKTELMQSKLAAIVEYTDDAIIGKTLDNIINSWNKGAERLYGYKAEEVLGISTAILYPEDRLDEFRETEREIKEGNPVHFLETERKHKDGHIIPVSVTISPVKNKAHELVGACSIGRDITEWKKVQQMKNDFISIVSHELRTPLTSVQGSLALLSAGNAGEMSEKAKTLLQIGKQNTERLIRLINDILDIAKIEAGKIDFKIEPMDMETVVKEAIGANLFFAEKFAITVKLISKTTAIVNADHDRVLQVITNLLSNAIKFSPQAGVVTVSIANNKHKISVSITNQGAGIPKEFRSSIFQKFSQANATTSRPQAGTGLGLSISKEIIERLHGTIGFHSEEGKETTFFFELPILGTESSEKIFFEKTPSILICQNDKQTSSNLKEFLAKNGFKVILTDTASDARSILADEKIDALMVDMMLPDMDGIVFIKELRKQYSALELPIIAISYATEDSINEFNGNAFSVLDWLDKPVSVERLIKDIQFIKEHIKVRTPTILFIEDEIDLMEVFGSLLQNEANIVGATNLHDARRELSQKKFDLIILDLMLPDGAGVDLLSDISKNNIPVIVFSAFDLPKNYTPYVTKILMKSKTSPQELLKVIDAALFKNKKLDE